MSEYKKEKQIGQKRLLNKLFHPRILIPEPSEIINFYGSGCFSICRILWITFQVLDKWVFLFALYSMKHPSKIIFVRILERTH